MSKLLTILILLTSSQAFGGDWSLLEPQKVSINAYQYEHFRDPYLAPIDQEIKNGGIFTVNADIAKYRGYGLFMENELFFDQSGETGQVRHGGWHYKVGATILRTDDMPKVIVYREHMSRHIFEDRRDVKFPTYDRFGAELILYEKSR